MTSKMDRRSCTMSRVALLLLLVAMAASSQAYMCTTTIDTPDGDFVSHYSCGCFCSCFGCIQRTSLDSGSVLPAGALRKQWRGSLLDK